MGEELQEIREMVVRIDERTALIRSTQKEEKEMAVARFRELDNRISTVEKKQNWILGVGSAIVFAGTAIWGVLKGVFGVV
jgi:UTP-glucose-1-phosphate uridylyltransferase